LFFDESVLTLFSVVCVIILNKWPAIAGHVIAILVQEKVTTATAYPVKNILDFSFKYL